MVQAEQAVERKVNRKTRSGVVVAHGNDKTVIVAVGSAARHRLYGKVIRRTKRYPVHDPENVATTGDLVVIEECRPISKTKRWRLVEVITEREVAEVAPESIDEALVDEMQRTAARAAAEAEEATEPTAVAEAEEPTAEAETEEPTAEAETEEPTAEAETEEPTAEAETEEPTAEAETEEPTAEAETEEPTAEAETEEPAAEARAEEPAAEAEADAPTAEAEAASDDDEEKTEESAAQ